MEIKIFKDLKKYTLTSALKKSDIETVKKYRPSALKKTDADGNDVFTVSYSEGHPSVAAFGVTFGGVSVADGRAMIVGDLPDKLGNGETYGDYVADKVGAALEYINEFEASIPVALAEINAQRSALISGITEA